MAFEEGNQPKDVDSKRTRTQITIKIFMKKILKHTSQGNARIKETVIMGLVSDIFKEYELIALASFTLAEDEADFEFDRTNERNTQGNRGVNVRVPADSKIVFQELSEKSGIPVWKIADHGLRIMSKYEYFSGKGTKWRRKIRDAIKGRVKSNLKKIQVLETEHIEEIQTVVEPVASVRPIARDRVYLDKKKQIHRIKLKLELMSTNRAVRYSLENQHNWYHTNIKELRALIERVERNRNPVTLEVISKNYHHIRGDILLRNYVEPYEGGLLIPIDKAKECYRAIKKEWSYPDWLIWFERLVSFWGDTHPYRKVKEADLSIGEWFSRYELDVPDVLWEIENNVVLNFTQLKRTGIITDIDLKIKKSLGIEDRIEYSYNNFDDLDQLGKTEISLLVNSSEGYNHQYAQLLREKLKRDKGSSPLQE